MAAILGLDAQVVRDVCARAAAEAGEAVEAVNFNDPKQTVIAGTAAGVARASEMLKATGARRALPLPVSAPFHSSLMKPAADRLRERLAGVAIAVPRIPVINNIDVRFETDPVAIRDALVRQAYGPVRWVELVQALRARDLDPLIECGPGKVLSVLVKRIDAEVQSMTLHDPQTLVQAREMVE
jgi:[acyl-carrier-protein] S-malonyltransferase